MCDVRKTSEFSVSLKGQESTTRKSPISVVCVDVKSVSRFTEEEMKVPKAHLTFTLSFSGGDEGADALIPSPFH